MQPIFHCVAQDTNYWFEIKARVVSNEGLSRQHLLLYKYMSMLSHRSSEIPFIVSQSLSPPADLPKPCHQLTDSHFSLEARRQEVALVSHDLAFFGPITMPMELVSKQFALNGLLKPEARLGLAISEFAQSLDSERRNEFRSMQTTQGARLSSRDIIKMTEEINQEGTRRHRSWRQHGTKLGGFLSRIQTFATIGDVLVGGSQNIIATGVWSALRLSLAVATNYFSFFDKLSTLFMMLGTSWDLNDDFAQLFPTSRVLQSYFCEYLVVVVRLCSKVVGFCTKTTGAQLFYNLGSSFESEYGPVQNELDQWGRLIQQQTQILATRITIDTQKAKFQDLMQRILRRLSPYQTDFETRWRRQRKKGDCRWIFNTPSFNNWKCMQTSATLSVNGKLGSGKTVSMANMVAQTSLEQPCAYVFCTSQESTSLKATSILGSIAYHLVDNLPAGVANEKAVSKTYTRKAFDPETIIDFLLSLLPNDRKYIIIADGLEDSSEAEINDVLVGLHRLMQNRVTLLCYSCRSDSRFQQLAKQRLMPKFSVTHDDENHDAEVEAFIVEEVKRRNASRHLSAELEELVKSQLLAGAQGMYLWVSLQLKTIFPASSKVVVTDDRIRNIIINLPKDLPEAFEQALETISDPQYKGRIMKLVMSAVTPLDLDQIRLALCVVVGDPAWHPQKVAKDGKQLISLCGGNLLEIDDEDGRVRFIHHSVIQHLLSPAASQSTAPYHFTAEDAECYFGAVCVTYFHLPVFDSRIAVSRNIQSLDILDNVMESTSRSLPGLRRVVDHIRAREHKRARPSQLDIGHILTHIQAVGMQQELDPRCFEPYAKSHWLFHTRFFDDQIQDCNESWKLWWRLLNGGVATIESPCPALNKKPLPALLWAIEHAHGSLFRHVLARSDLHRDPIAEIVRTLELRKSIHGKWLGDILAKYIESVHYVDMPDTSNKLIFLLDSGANPTVAHSTLETTPIQALTQKICAGRCSSEDEQKLMHDFFSHPAVKKSVDDQSVCLALESLLCRETKVAVAEILSCRPDLQIPARLKDQINRSLIEATE